MNFSPDTRFGGQAIGNEYFFELTGGSMALDFVNTLDEREGRERELISDISRLAQWAVQAGALSAQQVEAAVKVSGEGSDLLLSDAKCLREDLFHLFSCVVSGRKVSPDMMEAFNRWRKETCENSAIEFRDGAFVLTFGGASPSLRSVLWKIVQDAESILLDPERVSRVRQCQGHQCAWMFLDYSRQKNRRWCDMTVCGNRAKVKRFRAKS
ncbi:MULTISPECIES: CGNR zinc finger domain-containing protein [Kordiimonas]|jgi:predicted RNA-binding Zn ribbon-like protein|uniref:CGNR zinc finger domain-containing protein n=1 Tax=Kordiimonas TaxID=288021 RepID=UPI00257BADF3|nr:CGNR zinc finger domain-containing protein [Kordiimonas sp. UBA4487]